MSREAIIRDLLMTQAVGLQDASRSGLDADVDSEAREGFTPFYRCKTLLSSLSRKKNGQDKAEFIIIRDFLGTNMACFYSSQSRSYRARQVDKADIDNLNCADKLILVLEILGSAY